MAASELLYNPYDLVDRNGRRQVVPCLTYSDFVTDIIPLIRISSLKDPQEFGELYQASRECLAMSNGYGGEVLRIAKNWVKDFATELPADWEVMAEKEKIVLGTMLHLRIMSDETPNFGGIIVQRLVEERGLNLILAEKYMEFYCQMIEKRQEEYLEHLANWEKWFATPNSTIAYLAEKIMEKGTGYKRPRLADEFIAVFEVNANFLRQRSNYKKWGWAVHEMVAAAEEKVQACTEEFVPLLDNH